MTAVPAPPAAGARASAMKDGMDERLVELLGRIAPVKREEMLSRHTTFGIGGPAELFVTVRSAEDLAAAVMAARETGAPCFVLGAGSNILVGDQGVRGVVIDNQAKDVRIEPLRTGDEGAMALPPALAAAGPGQAAVVRAESGVSFAALARNLARDGYAGVEWACGIPGTLGGATVYNAGAYEGCLADVLMAASLIDGAGERRSVPAADLALGYRTSAILRGELGRCVVLSVDLGVVRGDARELLDKIAAYDRQRLDAQPRGRNSGSTFKNPPGRQAWELIDAVALRGQRSGDAMFSPKHCNFIENAGAARAADVAALIREAQQRVKERYGIDLVTEVEFVGEGFA